VALGAAMAVGAGGAHGGGGCAASAGGWVMGMMWMVRMVAVERVPIVPTHFVQRVSGRHLCRVQRGRVLRAEVEGLVVA
jgi:hypothetical protein